MAITAVDYLFWRHLRDEGLLPDDPDVLELGQANWYGDEDAACLPDVVRKYARAGDVANLLAGLRADPADPELPFRQAAVFYRAVTRFKSIVAVDLHGTPDAVPLDLNEPQPELYGKFDLTINTGTAEHVWNQFQFWRTAHNATRAGGLMVHFLPAWGWLDHGFVNYHPTFVADLAAANGYEVVKWWLYDLHKRDVVRVRRPQDVHQYAKVAGLGGSTMHAVAMRKRAAESFRVPMQGYYAGTLDPELTASWQTDR